MLTKLLSLIIITGPTATTINYINEFNKNIGSKIILNIENIITEDNFGVITDPSEKTLNKYLETKYNIDTNQIEYGYLGYDGVRINAKKDSNDYTGSKFVLNDSNLSYYFTGATKNTTVSVYSNTQRDTEEFKKEYTPELGQGAFTSYFKNVEFNWYAKTWNNRSKVSKGGGDRYHNSNNRSGGSTTQVPALTETFNITGFNLENTELYNREYSNVNWMRAFGWFGYSWENETLKMRFTIEASAYASAINANHAKSQNQLFIENLHFTK